MDLYEKKSGNQESYKKIDELNAIIGNLSLSDLNRVLYRADPEERDDGNGGGVYVLSETGALVYCGFQGMCLSVLWFSRYELECFVVYRYALWSTIVQSFKFQSTGKQSFDVTLAGFLSRHK